MADNDNNNNTQEQIPTNNPDASTTTNQTPNPNQPSPGQKRFEVELEFVQCLASPSYLNFLALNEYFDSPDFLAYLKYLLYWKKPEYARFIVFPQALYFLHMLQDASFREALKRNDYTMMIHQQQGYHWQYGKSLKLRSETNNVAGSTIQPTAGAENSTTPGTNVTAPTPKDNDSSPTSNPNTTIANGLASQSAT